MRGLTTYGGRVGATSVSPAASASDEQRAGKWLLPAGLLAFAAVLGVYLTYLLRHPLGWTLHALDLHVYYSGGLVARHVRPYWNPHLAAPLYDWAPSVSHGHYFTYPPFAALLFTTVSFLPWTLLTRVSIAANILFLLASAWFTFGMLGYRAGRSRAGAALLVSAAVLLAEPVMRDIYLGQINLALMALILWDFSQPDRRWWKGAGIGVAAGIKLVPLIFIPYLLLTRRFRQAAAACAGFALTVVVGYAVLPGDSRRWWLHEMFADSGRVVVFIGQESNQSLRGLITRLAGSTAAGVPPWVAAIAIVTVLGLGAAVLLARAGQDVAGVLACALTGLLVSPVSWDHHWVWMVPAVAVAAHYAVTAMRSQARDGWIRAALTWPAAAYWALAAGICVVYGAWPGALWGKSHILGNYGLGVIPVPGSTPDRVSARGDRPWFTEYHWHGWQVLTGNAFVLGGLALLAVLVGAAIRVTLTRAAGQPLPAISRPLAGPHSGKRREPATSLSTTLASPPGSATDQSASSPGSATDQPASPSVAPDLRREPSAYGFALEPDAGNKEA